MSEVTQAEVVKDWHESKRQPIEFPYIVQSAERRHGMVAHNLYATEAGAVKHAELRKTFDERVRIVHVTDGAPVDPNAKLRKLLEWSDPMEVTTVISKFRKKIRELIGDDDGQ